MDNPRPYRLGALGMVVDREDNILLIQHQSYKGNEWNFPGGGREGEETAEENVLRELSEELGVRPENFEVLFKADPMEYDFPQSMIDEGRPVALKYRGQRKDQFILRFTGDKSAIQLETKEISKIIWVPTNSLADYLMFPNQLECAQTALTSFHDQI